MLGGAGELLVVLSHQVKAGQEDLNFSVEMLEILVAHSDVNMYTSMSLCSTVGWTLELLDRHRNM